MANEKIIGIDVSKWNVITNYGAVRNDGVDFAIVRALMGKGATKDPAFDTHIKGFREAKIPVIAAYNYAYCNTQESAKYASDAFVSVCEKEGIAQAELDLEDSSMMGLGKNIVPIINIYRRTAEQAKMKFGIYTGAQFYNPYLKPYLSEIGDVPIWWARYPYIADTNTKKEVPSIEYLPAGVPIEGWQYSSKGRVSGVSGYVDMDVWYKDIPVTNVGDAISGVITCVYREPVRTLSRGYRGDDVKWAQWYLWRFGCLLDNAGVPNMDEIDGIFGVKTQAATREAQKRLGMKQTGYITVADRAIWKKLV